MAAFIFKGGASKLYKMQFSEKECLTTTWEFIRIFNLYFISVVVRVRKEVKLLALKQGDMTVSSYEDKFISLSYFTDNMSQTEEQKAQMFERGL